MEEEPLEPCAADKLSAMLEHADVNSVSKFWEESRMRIHLPLGQVASMLQELGMAPLKQHSLLTNPHGQFFVNRVYRLTLEDDSSIVCKVCHPWWLGARKVTHEVRGLRMAARLGVHVPRVLWYRDSPQLPSGTLLDRDARRDWLASQLNAEGHPQQGYDMLVMEDVGGSGVVNLAQVWPSLAWHRRKHWIDAIVQQLVRLQDWPSGAETVATGDAVAVPSSNGGVTRRTFTRAGRFQDDDCIVVGPYFDETAPCVDGKESAGPWLQWSQRLQMMVARLRVVAAERGASAEPLHAAQSSTTEAMGGSGNECVKQGRDSSDETSDEHATGEALDADECVEWTLLEQLEAELDAKRHANVPCIMTHGDVAPKNVLVRGDDVVAIVDWEWFRADWFGVDVWEMDVRGEPGNESFTDHPYDGESGVSYAEQAAWVHACWRKHSGFMSPWLQVREALRDACVQAAELCSQWNAANVKDLNRLARKAVACIVSGH